MSEVKDWYAKTYKGIWSDDVLNDAAVMKAWAEHLDDIRPSLSLEQIIEKLQKRENMLNYYRQNIP